MIKNLDRLTTPSSPGVMEETDQFTTLGVNADNRHLLRRVSTHLASDIEELLVTLPRIRRFDQPGLQALQVHSKRELHFLQQFANRFVRNLLDTAGAFVQKSEVGYSAAELMDIVHVKTKHALTHLYRNGRLQREKIGSSYIYLSPDSTIRFNAGHGSPYRSTRTAGTDQWRFRQ